MYRKIKQKTPGCLCLGWNVNKSPVQPHTSYKIAVCPQQPVDLWQVAAWELENWQHLCRRVKSSSAATEYITWWCDGDFKLKTQWRPRGELWWTICSASFCFFFCFCFFLHLNELLIYNNNSYCAYRPVALGFRHDWSPGLKNGQRKPFSCDCNFSPPKLCCGWSH